jgi:hypothetical protein
VKELMEAEVAQAKRDGLDLDALDWRQENLPTGLDSVQMDYVKTRFARQMHDAISQTKSLEEVVQLISKMPLSKIEGKSLEDLKADLSNQAGDILEQFKADLADKTRDIQSFGLGQKLIDLGQDPAAIPGLPHPRTLNRLVRKHLDGRAPEDLPSIQNILRYHIDRMTPKARVMFHRKAKLGGLFAAHRKGLIDLYLGSNGERVMPSITRGMEILNALGRNGFPYKMSLSVETINGIETLILRKGGQKQGAQLLASGEGAKLHVEDGHRWSDQVNEANENGGQPEGWQRVRPYIPKFPPLHPAVRVPKVKMPKNKVVTGVGNVFQGKRPSGNPWWTSKKASKVNDPEIKAEAEPEKKDAEMEPAPETKQSESGVPESNNQAKGELQIRASQELNLALSHIGRFTDGQEISIAISTGLPLTTYLKFVVDLSSRQVRMSEHTVRDLKNSRDTMSDPKDKILYEGLIEMRDQAFSLPIGAAPTGD